MYIIISNSSNKPIYEQIFDQIKEKIITGELIAGEMLPSIRSLAKDLKIRVITTKKAYEELERDGYIETIPGKGCFITSKNRELMKEEVIKKIEDNLSNIISMSKTINLNKNELIEIIDYLYEEE
jgi:GntR family transcriptional regulator